MSYVSGDPYWLKARFKSKCCRCGKEIKKGEEIFYFPKGKAVYCDSDSCGEKESNVFQASVEDERNYNGGYGGW